MSYEPTWRSIAAAFPRSTKVLLFSALLAPVLPLVFAQPMREAAIAICALGVVLLLLLHDEAEQAISALEDDLRHRNAEIARLKEQLCEVEHVSACSTGITRD